jgi:hypothetical protein
MEKRSFRSMIATASLVLGFSGVGSAHADNIGGFLGAVASATDVYGLTCPIGTANVRASVNDANNAAVQVSVHVINPHGRATTASAPNGGGFSPVVGLAGAAGGAGIYLIEVDKDAAGGEGYVVSVDCFNNNGVALPGNQAVLVQNQ